MQRAAGQTMLEGRSTLYLCQDYACQAPTSDLATVRKLLEE